MEELSIADVSATAIEAAQNRENTEEDISTSENIKEFTFNHKPTPFG